MFLSSSFQPPKDLRPKVSTPAKLQAYDLSLKNRVKAYAVDAFAGFYFSLICFKIIYQKLILELRYPDFAWSQVTLCLGIGLVFGLVVQFALPNLSLGAGLQGGLRDQKKEDHSWINSPYGLWGMVLLAQTFITGWVLGQVSFRELFSPDGLSGAKRIFQALFTPNWSIFSEVLFVAIETIYMAFMATAFAIPLAFLLSFFAASNLSKKSPLLKGIYSLIRIVMNLTRAIEPLVWAIILSVWVGIGPFAGMLALMLHSVASLTKLYSEQIETIDEGPLEAMMSTGAHPIQVVWFGVVPQVILPFLSYTIYRWDINVRMATIIGLVGGGGIGTLLMQYQGLAKWNEVGLIVIVIAVIVWAMDTMSSVIRNALK